MLPSDDQLTGLFELLDARRPLLVFDSVRDALDDGAETDQIDGLEFAVGLDSNVLLNLGKGRQGADVIDYLAQKHLGPIVLPTQALIEFWNNHVGGVEGLADRLRKSFGRLNDDIEQLDPSFRDFRRDADLILERFEDRYGHVLEERMAGQVDALFEGLQHKVIVPQVPRLDLAQIAGARSAAKIPPGFKDAGDGDFFVWAELLLGLQVARSSGSEFAQVVLVTDDRKSDWSTRGTAHPHLCAEVREWVGASFVTWSLESLQDHVGTVLTSDQIGGTEPVSGAISAEAHQEVEQGSNLEGSCGQ